MLMFSLVISCLNMLNLPWFMNLTFQVLMQYCSLQHWTLLSPSDTSTDECCFCFGPAILMGAISNYLLCLPGAYWTPSGLEGSSSGVISFFTFSYCPWGSPGKNTGVGCHLLLQWTAFCQKSSLWPIYLGWPCRVWLIVWLSYAIPSPQQVYDP